MFTLPRSVRIFIASAAIDMRKSIDGLMAIVKDELEGNAYSGHLFVFISRRCDRVKILTWDKGGFVLFYKRLERGQFRCRTWTRTRWPSRSTRPNSRCCSTGSTTRAFAGRRRGCRSKRSTDHRKHDQTSSMGGDDHRCEWREEAEALRTELATLRADFAKLQRHVFGQRSEKMPPVAEELRRAGETKADPEATLAKRRENAEKKKQLPSREIHHKIPDEKRCCPKCGGRDFTALGQGKATVVYEYVPARFERQIHIQEKLRCRCGETILTAEGAPKVYDKATYGPGFLAHVAVSKCADSIPLHRQAKQYRRNGIPLDRSTLVDLFHRTAEALAPLSARLVQIVAANEIVQADETTMRVQAKKKTRTAWLWTFLARDSADKEIISYVFSPSRSGETPVKVLGKTTGKLVVDGYTGYNRVTLPGGRERAGCLAHLRRRFFDALSTAPAAQRALDLILDVYRVERTALDQEILGTGSHLAMRREHSRRAMTELRAWLETEQPKHLPKGPMGEAISYALGQWDALTRFLDDPKLPVDNNASERALRAAALGRKNYLFVGHDEAGENLAGLYSLMATCEANGVNPFDYLADVLIRVQSHPASRIDELLPHYWKPPRAEPPA